MYKAILILLLYYSTSFAQNFKFGFDLEVSQIRISFPDGKSVLGTSQIPLSYHLDFTIEAIEKIFFQLKIGRATCTEFSGWEFGINGSYKFYKSLYVKTGILHHSNEGGGISNQLNVSSASILMIHLSVGVDVIEFLSIGLDYYIPTSKEVIVWQGFPEKQAQTFESMIRLASNFSWDI